MYDRDRIIRFVGEGLTRKGIPKRPIPVVLLTGPRGSGGSLVLDELWSRYADECLGVRLNLASAQGMEDVVLALTFGLGRRVFPISQISFRRVGMLLKALSFIDNGGGRTAFEAYMSAPAPESQGDSALEVWAARAGQLMTPEHRVLAEAAAGLLGALQSAVNRHRDKRVLRWLAEYGVVGGGGFDSLWDLYRLHRGRADGAPPPRVVAKTLCAALLADLRADFNDTSRWFQRPRNCLVLLDDAGAGTGALFLELLTECRSENHGDRSEGRSEGRGEGGRPDPAVVVAVQRRRAAGALAPTDDRLAFSVRHPAAPGDSDRPVWWYPVALAELKGESVVELCRSSVLGNHNRDAEYLRELTGGHPEAVALLAGVLARMEAEGLAGRTPPDPRLLLAQPLAPDGEPANLWAAETREGHTVEAQLLRRVFAEDLVAGPDGAPDPAANPELDAMAVLALTPGLRLGACNAALRFLGWRQTNAATATGRLTAALWLDQTPQGEATALHPLAALLLRRWLARRPEVWRDAHQGYIAHYAGAPDAALRHHHVLALAEPSRREPVTTVVGYLEGELAAREQTAGWVTVLEQVTAAPNRLRSSGDPRSLVTALAGVADSSDRRQALTRLVVARWIHRDRCADPTHRLAKTIANEYERLAEYVQDDEVLYREAARYRGIERYWKD